jgi:hypothetical protein
MVNQTLENTIEKHGGEVQPICSTGEGKITSSCVSLYPRDYRGEPNKLEFITYNRSVPLPQALSSRFGIY